MRIRLRIIYLLSLITLSSDTFKRIILNDHEWYFKVIYLLFFIWYLFVFSKLLIKISNYYAAVPKDSDRIYLQPWGKYYITLILFIFMGLYLIAINTPEVDFFYLLIGIIIGYDDDMYQVVYILGDRKYFYCEKYNIPKEILTYKVSDKYIDLVFSDEEHLQINTSFKTRKNKQQIMDFFR